MQFIFGARYIETKYIVSTPKRIDTSKMLQYAFIVLHRKAVVFECEGQLQLKLQ